ncbi:MAG TPA: transporter substrate-binding domain-containing protein [Pilimelia sp.]|nr:transporter substrate-binding domain-containing protein [Pilimelia sp.]
MANRYAPRVLGTVALLTVALAGCAPAADAPAPTTTGSPVPALSCDKSTLKTRTAGKLTIGTDNPAYEPWFTDNKPENGEGFEGAVAAAVAGKLGYAASDVTWTRVPFNNAIAPGPKQYDIDLNQFSITPERRKAVDFSAPYYLVRQSVIALKSGRIARATKLADLKNARLGAQVGTTSLVGITELIKPDREPRVYNSNDDAKKALQNKQIDGLVVDLPTAFFMTSAELRDAVIVGQLPQVGVPEQFGIVLDKDSPLTGCVSKAVDDLRREGLLTEMEEKWLGQVAGARDLT